MNVTQDTNAYYSINSPKDRAWYKVYEATGMKDTIDMPPQNTSLIEIYEGIFARYPNRVAFECMGASITYRELDTYSRQMAAYIQSLGLGKGDKIALMMPNVLQYPITMIGILRAGCTLVNVNPLYTEHELEHQLGDSEAKAIFIIENFAHTFEAVKNKGLISHVVIASMGDMLGMFKGFIVNTVVRKVKKMVPEWHLPGHVTYKTALNKFPASKYERPTGLTLSDLAVLQYTGGTTGVAKGAMLTHGNLVANLYQCMSYVETGFPESENTEGYHILVALPLYHIFCFTVCGLMAMEKGFTGLLIPNPRDLDGLVKEIDKYKPVFIPAVNTLFNGLAHHEGFCKLDHSNLRVSLGGGMSVLSNTATAWQEITGTPILEGYGLSETSPVLTMTPPKLNKYTGNIGIPAPATDIILLDDDGNEVPQGERGELSAKGPQVMAGYWKRPEATAKDMTEDGYFRTGDIAIMDEEGFFKIVDRKKDMILVSGFNVYPNEVEDAMTKHPKIKECGVIGLPNETSGETPKIFIVKADESLTEAEVKAFAKEHLTGYKRPRHIEFIDELPKSNVGKILRKDLRALEEAKNK
ncbi:MAG: long-chain fatty acid--CoA ligase [Gammaproteobacteria bacterium]|nr:MAG: long-chain fatty acid--CoA ligase [Gammaproteobacteria bacterium]